MYTPRWMKLGLELWPRAVGVADNAFWKAAGGQDMHFLLAIPGLAVYHLATCMETINYAVQYANNFYSVALCLLRQCVEALSIVDVGLQPPEYALPLLQKWEKGKLSLGKLRRRLESDVWSRYDRGLWSEPWSEFFGNLARAVQPYAHYSGDLQGWQVKIIHYDGNLKCRSFANLSPRAPDRHKTARVTVLQAIVTWAFARLLVANAPGASDLVAGTDQLQVALRDSKLLWAKKEWGTNLMPHMFFAPEADWVDD